MEPTVGMAADGKLALRDLLAELGGSTRASQWTAAELAAIKDRAYQEIKDLAPSKLRSLSPSAQELDDDAIVVSGTTEIGYWSHLAFPVYSPRSYITSGYFATLGFAFPTALGAKVGNPGRQVVATIGDGGFGYATSELATAVQEGINSVTLVFNNESLGASFADQQGRFGGRVIGTRLHNPDFVKLAEAYGAQGIKLAGHRDLGPALRDALKGRGARRHRGAIAQLDAALPDFTPRPHPAAMTQLTARESQRLIRYHGQSLRLLQDAMESVRQGRWSRCEACCGEASPWQ